MYPSAACLPCSNALRCRDEIRVYDVFNSGYLEAVERAAYLKDLEAVVGSIIYRLYMQGPGSLFPFFLFFIKLAHRLGDSESICDFLQYWRSV